MTQPSPVRNNPNTSCHNHMVFVSTAETEEKIEFSAPSRFRRLGRFINHKLVRIAGPYTPVLPEEINKPVEARNERTAGYLRSGVSGAAAAVTGSFGIYETIQDNQVSGAPLTVVAVGALSFALNCVRGAQQYSAREEHLRRLEQPERLDSSTD